VGFHSSHSICDALTVVAVGGCQLTDLSPVSPSARRYRCDCGGMLEYIRHISISGRLELYLYPTISIGEASCPPSHVSLYIHSQDLG